MVTSENEWIRPVDIGLDLQSFDKGGPKNIAENSSSAPGQNCNSSLFTSSVQT